MGVSLKFTGELGSLRRLGHGVNTINKRLLRPLAFLLIAFAVSSSFMVSSVSPAASTIEKKPPGAPATGAFDRTVLTVDAVFVFRGGNYNIALVSNFTSATIEIWFPNGTLSQRFTQNANTTRNIPVAANAPYGTYTIKAITPISTITTHIDVLDNTNWQPATLPYTRVWKNVEYTFFSNATIRAKQGRDILEIDLSTLRSLNTNLALTVAATKNDLNFKIKMSKGTFDVDLTFSFVYRGVKFTISGTLDRARNFDFDVAQNLVHPLRNTVDGVRSGNLVFDYGDLRKLTYSFDYNKNSRKLGVTVPKTFWLDPEIFASGFETGDTAEWTGTLTGDATLGVVTTPAAVHSGTYGAQAVVSGSRLDDYALVYKTLSPFSSISTRAYFSLTVLPSIGKATSLIMYTLDYDDRESVFIKNSGGTYYLGVIRYTAGSANREVATVPVSLAANTWFSVEFSLTISGSVGSEKVYFNGFEQTGLTRTNVDNDGGGTSENHVSVGVNGFDTSAMGQGGTNWAFNMFVDDVAVNLDGAHAKAIMPLGDSITKGYPGTEAYRKELYLDLIAAGYNVDFVGSQVSGLDFDSDHEGHNGYTADMIRDNVYSWLVTNPAEVVLLHIGTNDVQAGQDVSGIVAEVNSILNNIDVWESNYHVSVTVVLAQIILRGDSASWNLTTMAYNAALNTMALGRIAAGDNIVVVDMENALNYVTDLEPDFFHPNAAGYIKMANVWYSVLVNVLVDHSLSVTVVGSGVVLRAPDQAVYTYGTVVTLTADAADGWTFSGWSGDLDGAANPEHIRMDANKAVVATFTEIPSGSSVHLLLAVDPYGTTLSRGQSVTLRVTVLNQLNPQLSATLTLTITGPGNYYYYDFQPITVAANDVREYSFSWRIPNEVGTYVVETSLVPIQLTAYDASWLKVT